MGLRSSEADLWANMEDEVCSNKANTENLKWNKNREKPIWKSKHPRLMLSLATCVLQIETKQISDLR